MKLTDGANPSHRVTLTLGSTQVADSTWGGLVRHVISGEVPAGLLTSPTTSLKARVSVQTTPPPPLTPSTKEYMYLNFWEVDYRRLFQAFNDQMDFRAETAGTTQFLTSGFTANAVAVWDVTDPAQPKRLTGAAQRVEPELFSAFSGCDGCRSPLLAADRGELRRPSQYRPAVEHRGAAESGRRRRHGDRDAGVLASGGRDAGCLAPRARPAHRHCGSAGRVR